MTIEARYLSIENLLTGASRMIGPVELENIASEHSDQAEAKRFRSLCDTLKVGESVGVPGRPDLVIRGEG